MLVREAQVDEGVDVLDRGGAGDEVPSAFEPRVPGAGLVVVLVLDLPDDLLDDVLEGHQAVDVAELVDDEGHVHGLFLHLTEDLLERGGFRHEERLAEDVLDCKLFIINQIADDILAVNDAFDAVEPSPEDGVAGIAGRADRVQTRPRAGSRSRWP